MTVTALSRCLATVLPHDITVLLGDFNAIVHDDMGVWRGTDGPVSPDPLNDNVLRLLELCQSHNLYITNTYFQRKTIHQYTWYSNDRRTKKMIDYVIISKRWRSLVKICRTYRSAELGNADHRLVCADLRLRLHAQQSEQKPVTADIGKLKEPDTRKKCSIEILNRFETLGSLNSSKDRWKHFKLQTSEAAQLVLGKRSYPKKSWLSNETLQVLEQRRKARLLGDMTTYRRLNGVRNRLIHRDRTQFVARKADEIELAAKKKDMGSLFKHLRDITETKTPTLGAVLSMDGMDFTDDLDILADSMKQLQETLRILREEAAKVGLHINWNKAKIMSIDPSSPAVNSPVSLDSTTSIEVVKDFTYLGSVIPSNGSLLPKLQVILSKASSVMVSPPPPFPEWNHVHEMPSVVIYMDAVLMRLNKLDPNKAKGPNGIHPRLLKEAAALVAMPLADIFKISIRMMVILADWKLVNIVSIFKKGDKNNPENYRAISLTSVISKLLKITKSIEEGKAADVLLLDQAKAFNKVVHKYLLHKLHTHGVHADTVEWIRLFLIGQIQKVMVYSDDGDPIFSEPAPVISRVHQGSILGPTLFCIYINDCEDVQQNLITLYADDSKIIGIANRTLQNDLHTLSLWASTWMMEFNPSKCKVLHMGPHNNQVSYFMLDKFGTRIQAEAVESEKDLGWIRIRDHTLKWSNIDGNYTVNNEQIFPGLLKLTRSGPFQIAFGYAIHVAYMQHLEKED
ncbi:uncharacterized protein LOC136025720 [Artemia franciscana]|uniref:uncharacterized protein LOC136025720 n=1 Tax=Artemia franciscana TaxID=6661 RepID=UPI0032DBA40B